MLPAASIGLLWLVLVAWMSIAEQVTYNTTSRDIGVYLQVLWNTGHGQPFQTTLLETNRIHLAEHVAPLLAALTPLYAASPGPLWPIVAMQTALALAGLPIFLLARRLLGGVWLPTLCVAGYFAMPTLVEIAFDAFYPVSFTALPLGLAAYLLMVGRWRQGTACALVAPLIEEESALVVVGLGLFLLVRHGPRRWALALIAFGAIWLAVVALVLMPPLHERSTLSDRVPNRTLGHFSQLATHPGAVVNGVVGERLPLAARWLLVSTGGLALVAPDVLLVDLPHTATVLLADKEGRFRRHWAAPMLPMVWLATVVGLARLRRLPRVLPLAAAALVAGSLISFLADSSLPGGGDYEPEDTVWSDRAEQIRYLVSTIPPNESLASSRRALAFVANRHEVYVYPPSYGGDLWPPERRVANYLFDLTNDQTWEALGGRSTPLRARRPYTLVVAGPEALALIDHPPDPRVALTVDLGPLRLAGYDVVRHLDALEIVLHWVAVERPGSLTRVARVLGPDGQPLDEAPAWVLEALLPPAEWQPGQRVIDRIRFRSAPEGAARVEAGWLESDGLVRVANLDLHIR